MQIRLLMRCPCYFASGISITSPDYLPHLKVFLGAVRMGIMTAYAGLADSQVSVDGLQVGLVADRERTGGRTFGMFPHSL